jgi:parallel beta-helix repeat protein
LLGGNILNKNILAIGIIVLLLIAGGVSSAGIRVKEDVIQDDYTPSETYTSQTMIYVDDDNTEGPWEGTIEHPYQNIHDGVENASSGDTVYVYSGIYYEHINVNKAIDLIGEDKETTIIDGEGSGDVVHIFADWVNINSFTIQNSGGLGDDAGIDIRSNYSNIKDTNISNNQYGITLTSSDHNNISNNNISLNILYGIYLDSGSNNNSISWNIISDNDYGFSLKGATINKIFGNRVMNNQRGIYTCCGSVKNMFYYNIFKKNNEFNAFDSSNNQWNYGSTGNYWDDYTGVDSDGDGIGDIPYESGFVSNDESMG